ncbi:MAG: CDP-alcohol phosphatidyltransferase [Hyphomicrobiales bacterium]|nr:MAG: CDP-alcohol phosphatidyltransferase [Hyphomicrobiales bacterium]
MSIPNLITIGRIMLVPVIIYLMISGQFMASFWLFILAGISDGIDGFIAKQFDQATELGAYLDPIADKALLVSIYVTLGISGHLPVALVILVVSRDVLIVGAIILSWALGRNVEIAPLLVSKVNTAMQIALACVVLADLGFDLQLTWVTASFVVAVTIFTIWSGTSYMLAWVQDMAGQEKPAPEGATHNVAGEVGQKAVHAVSQTATRGRKSVHKPASGDAS